MQNKGWIRDPGIGKNNTRNRDPDPRVKKAPDPERMSNTGTAETVYTDPQIPWSRRIVRTHRVRCSCNTAWPQSSPTRILRVKN